MKFQFQFATLFIFLQLFQLLLFLSLSWLGGNELIPACNYVSALRIFFSLVCGSWHFFFTMSLLITCFNLFLCEVDWGVKGNFIAVARKNVLSILSVKFEEWISISLSFTSWLADSVPNCSLKGLHSAFHFSILIHYNVIYVCVYELFGLSICKFFVDLLAMIQSKGQFAKLSKRM